jgi:hypothetical protein
MSHGHSGALAVAITKGSADRWIFQQAEFTPIHHTTNRVSKVSQSGKTSTNFAGISNNLWPDPVGLFLNPDRVRDVASCRETFRGFSFPNPKMPWIFQSGVAQRRNGTTLSKPPSEP